MRFLYRYLHIYPYIVLNRRFESIFHSIQFCFDYDGFVIFTKYDPEYVWNIIRTFKNQIVSLKINTLYNTHRKFCDMIINELTNLKSLKVEDICPLSFIQNKKIERVSLSSIDFEKVVDIKYIKYGTFYPESYDEIIKISKCFTGLTYYEFNFRFCQLHETCRSIYNKDTNMLHNKNAWFHIF